MTENQLAVIFDAVIYDSNTLRNEIFRLRHIIKDVQSILVGNHPDVGLDAEMIVTVLKERLIGEPDGSSSQMKFEHNSPSNPLEDLRIAAERIRNGSYNLSLPPHSANYAGIIEAMVWSQIERESEHIKEPSPASLE